MTEHGPNKSTHRMSGIEINFKFGAQRPPLIGGLGCWANMRVFSLMAILALAGCCSEDPRLRMVPWSYVVDARDLPIKFSLEEIVTRTWVEPPGETMGLLSREALHIGAPQSMEVLVATFGSTISHRAVCVDFYGAPETRAGSGLPVYEGQQTYFLLCHDRGCPAYNTKVRYEEQGRRAIFFVSGDDEDPVSHKRFSRQYDYELNPKWQMVRGFSEIEGAPSR